jgi:hypothetical protein
MVGDFMRSLYLLLGGALSRRKRRNPARVEVLNRNVFGMISSVV